MLGPSAVPHRLAICLSGGRRGSRCSEITVGRVIFGEPDCEPLPGVTALESVGIMVDPAGRTLRRLPAIPLKSSAFAIEASHDNPLLEQTGSHSALFG